MNAQEQNKKESLLTRIVDATTAYAAPVVATALASGAVYYGGNPSNWTMQTAPVPTFGLLFGIPGLIGSLIWTRSTYLERSYRRKKNELALQERLETQEKEKVKSEREAAPKFIYQFETETMSEDAAESWMENIRRVTDIYSSKIFKSDLGTYSKRKRNTSYEQYISGTIAVFEESVAKEIVRTIESILPMERKSLTYKGKKLDLEIDMESK